MKVIALSLIIFGIIILIAPEILAYLIAGLLIFLGVVLFISGLKIDKVKKNMKTEVKFGNYKIFR